MTGMKDAYSIKVGFAPTRRDVFSKEDSLKYKKIIEDKIKGWGADVVNIEGINEEGLLFDNADVSKVIERFRKEGVDAIFCPHCNFGTEDAVARLGAKMDKPFLLWGPRDEAPLEDGTRLRDTQCGVFATSKVLRRFGVPFTYIINSRVEDPVFARGFENFVAAASVVKTFRNLRIGQISTRPGAFWTVIVNEGELLERFGLQTIPITLVEIINSVQHRLSENDASVKETAEDFKKRVDFSTVDDEFVLKMAALKLVIEEWIEGEGLTAVAIQCWSALQDVLGIMPCFVDSELTGIGIPIACETDIHGAVTSIMLQAARMGETPTFFTDLTIRHPENDNAELLWHCGPFPLSLRDEASPAAVSGHYVLEEGYPGVAEWRIRGGDITLARFDGDHSDYSLLIGQARSTEGPMNRGTYLWVEVNDWPLWEDRIIRGPYIHHVAGVHGKVAPVLYEACRYVPGLEADPIDPSEEEIRAWLRGA